MKLKKPFIPKPYIRIEIYRKRHDKSTEILMVEDTTLDEVKEWAKNILVEVVKSNIKQSLTIGITTKLVFSEWEVISVKPTSHNGYTGAKINRVKSTTFTTIGINPSKIKNALKKDLEKKEKDANRN